MKNKKPFLIVAMILLFSAVSTSLLKEEEWEVNAELLKEEVRSIEPSAKIVNLTDLTPFQWDTVYSFDPYTSKENIYETVGYKWGSIHETVNEGMNQLVFMNGEKVVCYLYGYPENIGYSISFTGERGAGDPSVSVLHASYDQPFQIEKKNHVIYLKNN
ncbi:hypothetical protein [Bacillus mesophilum]|uniref:Lipoprotein n=1 Tax=Bacillus mesophilum TaxID=1071718 RepID=A0A7V7UXJ2_9BACI|nr:hypothetical protein [Bacillus mesophilum]KAB2335649.1 hypothetical protein F7732_03505 [Bacillus mesophilum]